MTLVGEKRIHILTEKRRKVDDFEKRSLFQSVQSLILASKRGNWVYQNVLFTTTNWINGCWWFQIAKKLIQDIFITIKRSDVYGLLTDEVTVISNICQLVSFVKYYHCSKEKAEIVFFDCSNLYEFHENVATNVDIPCITEKFQELQIEISTLKVNRCWKRLVITSFLARFSPCLTGLKKTFETGSLNFPRISPAINKIQIRSTWSSKRL